MDLQALGEQMRARKDELTSGPTGRSPRQPARRSGEGAAASRG
jgi:hypothetical protein